MNPGGRSPPLQCKINFLYELYGRTDVRPAFCRIMNRADAVRPYPYERTDVRPCIISSA